MRKAAKIEARTEFADAFAEIQAADDAIADVTRRLPRASGTSSRRHAGP